MPGSNYRIENGLSVEDKPYLPVAMQRQLI